MAAIDCGTNSTRLLIAEPSGRALVRRMTITRLGQGVDRTQRLAPDAIDRTIDALRGYRRDMDQHRVAGGRQVATSAVRDAVNGHELLTRATETTGLPTELLSGREEGTLSFAGAVADLREVPSVSVVVDIGGGSTELSVGHRPSDVAVVSLDVGCVRLTERHFEHDPPLPDELEQARQDIRQHLVRAGEEVPALGSLPPGTQMIGLAGTVTTLAALDLGLDHHDRDRIHHHWLSLDAVEHWCEVLGSEGVAARRDRPAVASGREDVIHGGALILAELMAWLGLPGCLVSEADILDGLVRSVL